MVQVAPVVTGARRAALAVVVLLTAVGVAAAQPRSARLGFLSSSSIERDGVLLAAFRERMRELGYVEGRNLSIEQRYANGRFEDLPRIAAELVRMSLDVIVVGGAPAAHAVKHATNVIPIVMTNAADPVGTGLVTSLARPGGNVTGLSDFNAGVIAKRLELLKAVVPSASRIGVLLNPANPTNPLQLRLAREAAPALGVSLLPAEATTVAAIDRGFAEFAKQRVEAVLIVGDPFLGTQRTKLVELAARHRLPAIYSNSPYVERGGLMAYGTSFEELYRGAALYVDKILRGARPGDLPIEQPSKFELAVNLKAARALGVTIPPSVLALADRVIE